MSRVRELLLYQEKQINTLKKTESVEIIFFCFVTGVMDRIEYSLSRVSRVNIYRGVTGMKKFHGQLFRELSRVENHLSREKKKTLREVTEISFFLRVQFGLVTMVRQVSKVSF